MASQISDKAVISPKAKIGNNCKIFPFVYIEDYVEIGAGELKEQYRVTGYDIQSTPGVEYVTVDPTYEYDFTPAPQQQPGDSEDEFFWLNGGE